MANNNLLAPGTSLALMQATQANIAKPSSIEIAKATEAAQEFEAVFAAEMMKPMFEGISSDGMFGGGKGEEVFHGMLVQEYGKLMAQTGSIGIADSVKEEMIRMQSQIDQGVNVSHES
jgi:flagellar protein FlgJ